MRNSELQRLTTEIPSTAATVEHEPRAATLHVVYPPELAQSFALERPQVTLGRQPGDGTPPLLHTLVSRKHFAIEWDAERHFHSGVDLGSGNGSAIDGPGLGLMERQRLKMWLNHAYGEIARIGA